MSSHLVRVVTFQYFNFPNTNQQSSSPLNDLHVLLVIIALFIVIMIIFIVVVLDFIMDFIQFIVYVITPTQSFDFDSITIEFHYQL